MKTVYQATNELYKATRWIYDSSSEVMRILNEEEFVN